jgi:hypothetical protein
MRIILLLIAVSFAVGVAGGSGLAPPQGQCWCIGCNCLDSAPTGCMVSHECNYVQNCPDFQNNCTLVYGWCLHVRCTICHTQAPGQFEPEIPQIADQWQCTTELGCQYASALCLGAC